MASRKTKSYQAAEEKIKTAIRKNSTDLDLSGGPKESSKLSDVPELLVELTQLRSLNLSSNSLTSLPEFLGNLTQLRSLSVDQNLLTTLPESLVHLQRLGSLSISNNPIGSVPAALRNLRQLKTLRLSGNHLKSLPEWLGELKQLRSLTLGNDELASLPDGLGQLTQLHTLWVTHTTLTELPASLERLSNLVHLYLFDNRLTSFPEWIGRLQSLETLSVLNNKLNELPDSIGQLKRLKHLNLSDNELSTLPSSLGDLRLLRNLDLERNRLIALPDSIGKLSNLTRLDLSDNLLTWLPESLAELPTLKQLFLHGNPGLHLSADILGPSWSDVAGDKDAAPPKAILAFYFSQRKQGSRPLNEVKLLLVGHGRVGKTSLSKALRNIAHDRREPETPGIERHPLPLVAGRSKLTAHIWDFGGQEFLHQTHQFFFSERSIYVVVLSGRQGRPMQEAEYWLRLIRTYGTGSPVVIALNQIKAHPFSVDEHFLQENYPEVKAVVRTECDPRRGIEPLRKLLGRLAGRMPSVKERIDPAWARVRGRLENMRESFVSFQRYRQICAEEGVNAAETQETLATILDCLGIALNYRNDPRLRDTSVLKPRWLVDGIYTILRWLHKHETNGEMSLKDFPKALKSKRAYPPAMYKFLLALMEKFELCFPIAEKKGAYLVPGLLDENQPLVLKKFMSSEARRIQFRYDDVRPPGLLPRFIVRSHTLSERQPRWLRGVVLARGQARALVRGDHEGRVTDVFALGHEVEDRVWLTEFILSEMRTLNDKLPVQTFVESESQPGAWSELEVLRDAARKEEKTRSERAAHGGTVLVDVKQTLGEVESTEANLSREKSLPLFICYAHANERAVRQLIPSLKVLARRGYLTPWRDTDLVPGEDWDAVIRERLRKARIVMFMVSREFLASDYITHEERPLAMTLMAKKRAMVVPVILLPCTFHEEDFARLENLPRKDSPVSSFNPRAEAWKLVEEGLKRAVEQMRKSSSIRRTD